MTKRKKPVKPRTESRRGVGSLDDAREWLRERGIEDIECVVPDQAGVARGEHSIPALSAAIDSVLEADLPVITATVLVAGSFIVVANVVVDLLYAVIDPRVRLV